MADRADAAGVPIIGPDAGAVLRLLARLTDAARVFEFGSGFGYSATWFLRGGADRVVRTEVDADEAEQGRACMREGGHDGRATDEVGDAMDAIDRYDGPFDAVLIDHDKPRYADAFAAVAPKLAANPVVIADNVTRGPIDFAALSAAVVDGAPLPSADDDPATAGIARYLRTVRAEPGFHTAVLPVGSGLAVTTRAPDGDASG